MAVDVEQVLEDVFAWQNLVDHEKESEGYAHVGRWKSEEVSLPDKTWRFAKSFGEAHPLGVRVTSVEVISFRLPEEATNEDVIALLRAYRKANRR